MDKETLSNYGWIVICVLVLAVMIALATPFGGFIADAVKSTTQGLFDVNQNALNSTGLINIGDQSFGEGGNGGNGGAGGSGDAGDQGGTGLPAVGTSAEDCTWDEIKAISEAGKGDDYFNLGDTKTFTTTDGIEVVMEIVAFNADTKADSTGTAGITWISKNIFAEHNMNSSHKTTDGWEASDMRTWLQNDVYNRIPSAVQSAIVEVGKTYYDYTSKSTKSCIDNIWIPSYREIFGGDSSETSGAIYTNHFSNNNSRIKSYNGNTFRWWLRSACGSENYHAIYLDGSNNRYWNAGAEYGVAFGFCT